MRSAYGFKFGSAALLQLLLPFSLAGLSNAGQNAYQALLAQNGAEAPEAPAPAAVRLEAPRVNTGDLRAIKALSDEQMYAATNDQKLAMLSTLIKNSHPNQNDQDSQDYDQEETEKAIMRLLGSAQDDASFDRLFYNTDQTALFNSVSYSPDIKKMAARHLAATVPGDWAGLGRYVDTVDATRSAGRNFVEFMIDGGSVLGPAEASIDGAKKSIHIEVYQLQGDDIGWAVGKKLAAKAKEGVKVRVVIDQYGSAVDKDPEVQKLLAFMNANGVEARQHKSGFLTGHRDHRKVMVIDGDTGFTGGMNIGSLYQQKWHDQQTFVSGPAVADLQKAFVEKWQASGGVIPAGEELYPPLQEVSTGVETRVVTHRGGADQNIKAMYLRAISTAQRSIRIANPYFVDPEIVKVLVKAAGRGVKVQIVEPEDNDMKIVQRGSRAFYPDLLKAGVEIYEYQGRMAHEKVAVMDGYWVTCGSSNLDSRSLVVNDELNLMVFDAGLARYVESQLFDNDIKNSKRITSYSPDLQEHLDAALHGWL
jgi:cardiolipin synthase